MTFKANNRFYSQKTDKYKWEQVQSQYIELVNKFGIACYYLVKENLNLSMFINHYEKGFYDNGIEMRLIKESIVDFGNNDMFTKFGFVSNDNLTFYGVISIFEEIGVKPKRGDLIFCPTIGNKIFEVSHVDRETPKLKYQFDKIPIALQIQTSLYKPNMSLINANPIQEVDELNSKELEKTIEKQKEIIEDKQVIKPYVKRDPLLD
jgi:hypothetical protein